MMYIYIIYTSDAAVEHDSPGPAFPTLDAASRYVDNREIFDGVDPKRIQIMRMGLYLAGNIPGRPKGPVHEWVEKMEV